MLVNYTRKEVESGESKSFAELKKPTATVARNPTSSTRHGTNRTRTSPISVSVSKDGATPNSLTLLYSRRRWCLV